MKRTFAVITALTLAGILLLTGCRQNTGTTGDISRAVCAVLYTTDAGDISQIEWLNQDWDVTATSRYSFSGASLDGFANASMQNGNIVLVPRGDIQNRDYGNIILIDTKSGDAQEIKTGRTNPTGFAAEGHKIALTSNLNAVCYVDLIDTQTKEVQSVTASDCGLYIMDVFLMDGQIYGYALHDGTDGCCVCRVETEHKTCETIMELPDASTFFARHGQNLLFLSDGQLITYDTQTCAVNRQPLTRKDAFNINMSGDIIWIAYTDIHEENCHSLVEARDCATGNIICSASHEGAILQMECSGENVFIFGVDRLYQYQINGKTLDPVKNRTCQKNGYFIGGFYPFASLEQSSEVMS